MVSRAVDLDNLREKILIGVEESLQPILLRLIDYYEEEIQKEEPDLPIGDNEARSLFGEARFDAKKGIVNVAKITVDAFNEDPREFLKILDQNLDALIPHNLMLSFDQYVDICALFMTNSNLHLSKSEKFALKFVFDYPEYSTKEAIIISLESLKGRIDKELNLYTLVNAISTARKKFDFNILARTDYYRFGLSLFHTIMWLDYDANTEISIKHPYMRNLVNIADFPQMYRAVNAGIYVPEGKEKKLADSIKSHELVKKAYFFKIDHEYRVANPFWFEKKNGFWNVQEETIYSLLTALPKEFDEQLIDYEPRVPLYLWRDPNVKFPDRGTRLFDPLNIELFEFIDGINPSTESRKRIFRPTPWSVYSYLKQKVSRRAVDKYWRILFRRKLLMWFAAPQVIYPNILVMWIKDPSEVTKLSLKLILEYLPKSYMAIGKDLYNEKIEHLYLEIEMPYHTRMPWILKRHLERYSPESLAIIGEAEIPPISMFRMAPKWDMDNEHWKWDKEWNKIEINTK